MRSSKASTSTLSAFALSKEVKSVTLEATIDLILNYLFSSIVNSSVLTELITLT
jgi:hypothetical protein